MDNGAAPADCTAAVLDALRPDTQRDYANHLNKIEAWAGEVPLAEITKKSCRDYYKAVAAKTATAAKNRLSILRAIFAWRMLENFAPFKDENNPARKLRVKTPKVTSRLWEPEDGTAFVGTAVQLNIWMGQRRAIFWSWLGATTNQAASRSTSSRP
ncbi:MAG: site-specific integrase [Rhodospirillaceae bacterium]|jgi:hypothetical protein|nr:site-specific integrase [Rhodospirillaceae bacterium]MBT6427310.1 site-specific integrase [Rhodospirillaceae bacterium]MBT7757173.1 site-specific integrase [Rhodospirillaceae bacterium]